MADELLYAELKHLCLLDLPWGLNADPARTGCPATAAGYFLFFVDTKLTTNLVQARSDRRERSSVSPRGFRLARERPRRSPPTDNEETSGGCSLVDRSVNLLLLMFAVKLGQLQGGSNLRRTRGL